MSSAQLMDATPSRSHLRRFAILCTTIFVSAGFAAAAAEKLQHQVSALLALLASGATVLRPSRNRSSVGATTGRDSVTRSSPVQSLAPAKHRVPVLIFDTTGGQTIVLSPERRVQRRVARASRRCRRQSSAT